MPVANRHRTNMCAADTSRGKMSALHSRVTDRRGANRPGVKCSAATDKAASLAEVTLPSASLVEVTARSLSLSVETLSGDSFNEVTA